MSFLYYSPNGDNDAKLTDVALLLIFMYIWFVVCVDTDPCLLNNGGCSALAVCSSMPGGAECTCLAGFIGDGYNCSGKSSPYRQFSIYLVSTK